MADFIPCAGCDEPEACAIVNRCLEPPSETNYEALRQAAEQFVASCNDGNVRELLDYYEEIFREALAGLELEATPVASQKPANLSGNEEDQRG